MMITSAAATDPFVAVIIPCRNEAQTILDVVDSILESAHPRDRLEVVFVDGMSTDGTRKILEEASRRHDFIRVLDNPLQVTPAAMNLGIRATRAEIIVRMDAHSEYLPDYIPRCVRLLKSGPKVGVAGGRVVPLLRDASPWTRAVAFVTTHRFGVGGAEFRTGVRPGLVDTVACGTFWRAVLEEVGMYDERLTRNQDNELSARLHEAGYQVVFDPDIKIQYRNQRTLKGLVRQAFFTSMWNVYTLLLHPYTWKWRRFIPMGFVAYLSIFAAAAASGARGTALLALPLALYSVLVAVVSLGSGLKGGGRARVAGTFVSYHLAYGAGSFFGIVNVLTGRWRTYLGRPLIKGGVIMTDSIERLLEPPAAPVRSADPDVPFHKACLGEEELAEVAAAIRSGWITMGPKTVEFEERFKSYLCARARLPATDLFAVSVNSATAAMHLALKAVGLKRGDEVIIPTNTFIATAEVVTYFGAVPVLCDIEEDTHNMAVSSLERLITPRTKVVIPVHFGGLPCDMDEIMAIARRRGLTVIEDAAHALPSEYKGRIIGTIGDITCFSFYATKTLAMGEGGMVVTANKAYAERVKINRLHGISRDAWDRYTLKGNWYYEVVDNGFKYNTTDINAGLGLAQLRKLDAMNAARERIAAVYDFAFEGTQVATIAPRGDRSTCRHLYVIKIDNRDELHEKMKLDGIGTSVHFIPVHKHPHYRDTYGYRDAEYPSANRVFEKALSLPIYPDMTAEQVERVWTSVLRHAR